MDYDNYKFVVNGTATFDIHKAREIGTYNMLMWESPFYDAEKETFESSHELFREAFEESFPGKSSRSFQVGISDNEDSETPCLYFWNPL